MKKFWRNLFDSSTGQIIIVFLATFYIRLVYYTSNVKFINKEIIDNYIKSDKSFIICFWHGRLLMMASAWQWKKPFYMLISDHRDGRFISKVVESFSIKTIIGSTERQGAQAARSLIKALESGVIGITPDGPRGPNQVVSPGIISLSKLAKVDIIPITFSCKRKKYLKTWDNFCLAFPFNRSIFYVGTPIKHDIEREQARQFLEKEMINITSIADSWEK